MYLQTGNGPAQGLEAQRAGGKEDSGSRHDKIKGLPGHPIATILYSNFVCIVTFTYVDFSYYSNSGNGIKLALKFSFWRA